MFNFEQPTMESFDIFDIIPPLLLDIALEMGSGEQGWREERISVIRIISGFVCLTIVRNRAGGRHQNASAAIEFARQKRFVRMPYGSGRKSRDATSTPQGRASAYSSG